MKFGKDVVYMNTPEGTAPFDITTLVSIRWSSYGGWVFLFAREDSKDPQRVYDSSETTYRRTALKLKKYLFPRDDFYFLTDIESIQILNLRYVDLKKTLGTWGEYEFTDRFNHGYRYTIHLSVGDGYHYAENHLQFARDLVPKVEKFTGQRYGPKNIPNNKLYLDGREFSVDDILYVKPYHAKTQIRFCDGHVYSVQHHDAFHIVMAKKKFVAIRNRKPDEDPGFDIRSVSADGLISALVPPEEPSSSYSYLNPRESVNDIIPYSLIVNLERIDLDESTRAIDFGDDGFGVPRANPISFLCDQYGYRYYGAAMTERMARKLRYQSERYFKGVSDENQ